MTTFSDSDLLLQRFYGHVDKRGGDIYCMAKPVEGGDLTGEEYAEAHEPTFFNGEVVVFAQRILRWMTEVDRAYARVRVDEMPKGVVDRLRGALV